MKSRIRFSISSIVVGAFVLATLIFAGLCAPMSALPQTTPRTLVAVLAHPDDEGPAGPVLARYAREGVQVHLIVASNETRALEPTPSFFVLSRSQPATGWVRCELKKPAAQLARWEPIPQYCSALLMASWVTTSVIEHLSTV